MPWYSPNGSDSLVVNSAALSELYGYFPSFHDAFVTDIKPNGQDLDIRFYVYDSPNEGLAKQDWDHDLHTQVWLKWSAVTEASLELPENYIYEMKVTKVAGELVTEMLSSSGYWFRIKSATVEVREITRVTDRFFHTMSDVSLHLTAEGWQISFEVNGRQIKLKIAAI